MNIVTNISVIIFEFSTLIFIVFIFIVLFIILPSTSSFHIAKDSCSLSEDEEIESSSLIDEIFDIFSSCIIIFREFIFILFIIVVIVIIIVVFVVVVFLLIVGLSSRVVVIVVIRRVRTGWIRCWIALLMTVPISREIPVGGLTESILDVNINGGNIVLVEFIARVSVVRFTVITIIIEIIVMFVVPNFTG